MSEINEIKNTEINNELMDKKKPKGRPRTIPDELRKPKREKRVVSDKVVEPREPRKKGRPFGTGLNTEKKQYKSKSQEYVKKYEQIVSNACQRYTQELPKIFAAIA